MKPRDGPAADYGETTMARLNLQPTLIGRKPTHRLYRVLGDGKTAIWTPIGAAWPNKDGLGFSLQCDAIPLQGRLVLREITEREEQAQAA
jgi:hypothetical protein